MEITDAMIRAWLDMIPRRATLPAPVQRIITHWTGGGPKPSTYERTRYHFLVGQPEGYITAGVQVTKNMRNLALNTDGGYAAHTASFNSYSVGLSFCGMLGALPGRRFGRYPLQEHQVRRGLSFAALCCRLWDLDPANPAHFFTHAEAWDIHRQGETNEWKWDITEVPWLPAGTNVGNWLRDTCREYYDNIHLVCP